MNKLEIFDHPDFGKIRTVTIDGETWLVGKDVAEALGYSNPRKALIDHVPSEDKNTVTIRDGIRGNPNMTVINESGLYALTFSSKLPGAKAFTHWVTHDVLPSIRKHGGYIAGQEDMTDEELLSRALLIANRKIEERDAKIAELKTVNADQQKTLDTWKPTVDFANRIFNANGDMTISQIAVDYGMTARELNKILQEEGIQWKVGGQWILRKPYMGKGYTRSETYLIQTSAGDTFKCHTRWTQAGRKLIDDILKNRETELRLF